MGFLIDGVLILVLVLVVVWSARQTISSALFSLLAGIAAVAVAFFASAPLSVFPAEQWIAPAVERRVANDLADMVSAPHLDTGRQTVASLPLDEMLREQPAPYLELLERWGAQPDAVRRAYQQQHSPVAALTAVTDGFCRATARAGTFFALALVLFVLLRLLLRRVEMNLPPPARYAPIQRAIPALIGVARGLLVLFALVTVLEWVLPYCGDRLPALDSSSLSTADVYNLLRRFNPLSMFSR
jgi:uncharacterized membrane protein required for colicin V production